MAVRVRLRKRREREIAREGSQREKVLSSWDSLAACQQKRERHRNRGGRGGMGDGECWLAFRGDQNDFMHSTAVQARQGGQSKVANAKRSRESRRGGGGREKEDEREVETGEESTVQERERRGSQCTRWKNHRG